MGTGAGNQFLAMKGSQRYAGVGVAVKARVGVLVGVRVLVGDGLLVAVGVTVSYWTTNCGGYDPSLVENPRRDESYPDTSGARTIMPWLA